MHHWSMSTQYSRRNYHRSSANINPASAIPTALLASVRQFPWFTSRPGAHAKQATAGAATANYIKQAIKCTNLPHNRLRDTLFGCG